MTGVLWEACHQMCRALAESEGDAGALLARMRAYNDLVTSWPVIVEASRKAGLRGEQLALPT